MQSVGTMLAALREAGSALADSAPVLSLELRVSGRHLRTYVFRLAFLVCLGLYAAVVWLAAVGEGFGGPAASGAQRMADAGARIVRDLVWFLYVAGQVAAILLLSNAFTPELRGGALPALLCTPLGCVQIVLGRFVGRLAQLLILLAAAMPALAILRVFGGVPWGFVIAGMCLTLSACALAGALAMMYSIRFHRPYNVILRAGLMTAVLALPSLLWLGKCSQGLVSPAQTDWHLWPWGCLLTLCIAGLALIRCMWQFRAAAARAVGHEPGPVPGMFEMLRSIRLLGRADEASPTGPRPLPGRGVPRELVHWSEGSTVVDAVYGSHRPPLPASEVLEAMRQTADIAGSPIVWRALRRRFFDDRRHLFAIAGIVLVYLYGFAAAGRWVAAVGFHVVFLPALLLVGGACLAVLSATAIASEKEAGCWALLLATPLSDREILLAKISAILRRCMLAGAILGAHLVLFAVGLVLPPIAVGHVLMVAAYETLFLLGLGLYCSARCRRTTTALMVTFGVAGGLWLVAPPVLRLVARIAGPEPAGWIELGRLAGPFAQIPAILEGAMIYPGAGVGPYVWAGRRIGALAFTGWMGLYTLLWSAAGGAMIWLAERCFRRHVY